MFGETEFIQRSIAVISILAALQDLRWRKIYNLFNLGAALLGLGVSFYFNGISGLFSSSLGLLAALGLMGWMFALGFIGGGDVKFLMALGCWGGWKYSVEVAILSILVGGVFSVLILISKRRFIRFLRNLHSFLLSIFIRELEILPLSVDHSLTMPFGVPIAISAIWVIFYHPIKFGLGFHWL